MSTLTLNLHCIILRLVLFILFNRACVRVYCKGSSELFSIKKFPFPWSCSQFQLMNPGSYHSWSKNFVVQFAALITAKMRQFNFKVSVWSGAWPTQVWRADCNILSPYHKIFMRTFILWCLNAIDKVFFRWYLQFVFCLATIMEYGTSAYVLIVLYCLYHLQISGQDFHPRWWYLSQDMQNLYRLWSLRLWIELEEALFDYLDLLL